MLKEQEKGFIVLNGSNVLITYLFHLFKPIQSTTQNLSKQIFHEHCQICIFMDGMRRLTFPRKENNIYYLLTL